MRPLARLILPLLFALPLSVAYAGHEPMSGPEMGADHEQWCADHKDQCEKMKEHHKEFCAKNPVSCKRMEATRSEHEQWCKSNPADCEKMKEEHKEKMKERCAKNPEQCEKMKESFRKNHPKMNKDPA